MSASEIWLPVAAVVSAVASQAAKLVQPSKHWSTIHDLLTAYRGILFPREISAGAPNDDHRLTLFKRVWWRWWFCRWPWGGWLLPVERSGETTMTSTSAFRAPDKSIDSEGVAGKAYYAETFVKREGLPDLTREEVSESDWMAYAEATECTVAYLKKRKPAARSYVGFLVRVGGRPWGAVVIDSSNEHVTANEEVLGQLRTVLGIILD